MPLIPDAAHLLKLRERLWDGRAALAAALHKWYTQYVHDPPAEVDEWKALAVNDPLPEVRNEWERGVKKQGDQLEENDEE